MTFRVGQKVVCVRVKMPSWTLRYGVVGPSEGGVYTIRSVTGFSLGPIVLLNELRNPECCMNDDIGIKTEPYFPAAWFRPIVERKTSIEIFKRMLLPQGVEA
jgi:hypothetical protein